MSTSMDHKLVNQLLLPKELSAIERSSFSIDDFFEGVNLNDEKGKVWNVRFAISEGTNEIFMRAHSFDSIEGRHLAYKQVDVSRINTKEWRGIDTGELIICRTIQYDHGSIGSGQTKYTKQKSDTDKISSFFSKLIANGQKVEKNTPPKTTQAAADSVRKFFNSCPELIPVVEKKPAKVTPKSVTKKSKTPESNGLFLKVIGGLGAIFLLYLVARYAQNFWKAPSVA